MGQVRVIQAYRGDMGSQRVTQSKLGGAGATNRPAVAPQGDPGGSRVTQGTTVGDTGMPCPHSPLHPGVPAAERLQHLSLGPCQQVGV